MKLVNDELKGKIWDDIHDKVLKYAPYGSHVRYHIRKNIGLWNGSLFGSKIGNPNMNIGWDLDETA